MCFDYDICKLLSVLRLLMCFLLSPDSQLLSVTGGEATSAFFKKMSGFDAISWSFGLRNSAGNYLTAEAFGFSINATGKLMKKKQIFFLEQNGNDAYIKT